MSSSPNAAEIMSTKNKPKVLSPYKNGCARVSSPDPMKTLHDDATTSANWLLQRTKHRPVIAIICGSGLGGLADLLEDAESFHYKDIPNFPISTVPGHAGKLVFGNLNGKTCVCMQGRVHGYEGYPMWQITLPVRVFAQLGAEVMMATNACGGLNSEYNVGDLMIIKDHINLPGLAGFNPLIGYNDSRMGTRFVAMSSAYDRELRRLCKKVSKDIGFDFVREGVYMYQLGPCFETVAECHMMKLMGADVTGMSTAPEIIVARQLGMRCFGMSLVTNACIMDEDAEETANHEEVLETGRMRSKDMQTLICNMIGSISLSKLIENGE